MTAPDSGPETGRETGPGPAEAAALALFARMDPERAHGLALRLLEGRARAGLAPRPPGPFPRLAGRAMGLELPNPVGIAAGFDKNARAIGGALGAGFGFVEIGGVTPRPQPGNPRPRLFRLAEDRAVINRFGFNNDGMEVVARRLEAARARGVRGVVGVNLGANKDSPDRAADYAAVLTRFAASADFFTVNVSSPNTERLRDLQGAEALRAVLAGAQAARDAHAPGKPVLVKIAPDLDEAGLEGVAEVAVSLKVDGIVAVNTTLSREGLTSRHRDQAGGLSGAPLRLRARQVLARLARLTAGSGVTLVAVGGIADADEAYARIRAGARLLQLYSGLVYGGVSLGGRIAAGLDARLARDGFSHLDRAVGADL